MVAAVVSIALRFGGRSDQVLERMAAFMRDVSQARSELSASSAEIRLSAWILPRCRWARRFHHRGQQRSVRGIVGGPAGLQDAGDRRGHAGRRILLAVSHGQIHLTGARMQALESLNPTLVLAMALTLVAVAMLVLGVSMVRRLRGQGRSRWSSTRRWPLAADGPRRPSLRSRVAWPPRLARRIPSASA